MKAIVAGATGATGSELIAQLATDQRFDEVIALVRRSPGHARQNVVYHVVDFDLPQMWHGLVQGDVLFLCMGTTLKLAGSKDAQFRVDHTYQLNVAREAAENGVKTCVLISSYGANSSASNFYLKMKGTIDDSMMALGFGNLCIIRPGQIHGKRAMKRTTETIGLKVMYFFNAIGILRRFKPITTQKLAAAMIHAAVNKRDYVFVELEKVHLLAENKL